MNKFPIFIRIFAITIATVFGSQAYTQDFNYFNRIYDISESQLKDDCTDIVQNGNGFVIAGATIVISGNIHWWEENLTKLDEFGAIQFIKTYGEDSIDYYFGYTGSLINDGDQFFMVGKRRTPSGNWVHDEGTLMALNENMDTLWMKKFGEYSDPNDTAYLFMCLDTTSQNSLIIAGSWMPYGLATHAYILQTDITGNKIWEKSFSYYDDYIDAYSVVQTSDGGFLLGCYKQTVGYPVTVDPVLIKTDSAGNQEWIKNIGGPYKDFIPMVAQAGDGNIIVGTSYADSMYTPDVALTRINILKLDNEGNIIWNKKYGYKQRNNILRNIKVMEDGSIIAIGHVNKSNPEPERVGWIFKTTADGDSLWYREYIYFSGQESKNSLFDIISTSDNGLIACGFVDPHDPDTGSFDTWVIKLDSIGCEFAGCDTTVGVKERGGMEAYRQGGLEIWPNPASKIVDCRLSNSDGRSDFTLMIYDIFGRPAPTPALPHLGEGEVRWALDVSGLPTGVYFISIVQDGRRVAGGKMVVCK